MIPENRAECITKALLELRSMAAMAADISGGGEILQSSARLVLKKGRVVGVCLTCEFRKNCSDGCALELLERFVAQVSSGYGEVEVVLGPNSEVVGGRWLVSYDLKSFM